MEQKVINWGIISCAAIAEGQFIPGLLAADNGRLYAISSRNQNDKLTRFAQKFEPVKVYDSYEELLDDPNIDAIYNPLPNGLHAQWTIKALVKKKHVLCEKPLGATAKEVEQMFAASKENGVLLMEAFAYRHSPLTHKLKELVTSGAIGNLRHIESNFSFLLDNLEDVRLSKDLAGGATYDIGCYNLSLIRYIAGQEPSEISAVGKIGNQSKVDEESCILLAFPNGVTATSFCSFDTYNRCSYTICGAKGTIFVPHMFNVAGKIAITLSSGGQEQEIIVDCPQNYMLEAQQFGRAILGQEVPLVSAEESLGNAKVIDKVLEQITK